MKAYTTAGGEECYALTFEEKIRMNSLIQGGIDLKAFECWYNGLSNEERMALTRTLFDVFICEQHYSGGKIVVLKALELAGMSLADPLVNALLESVGGFDPQSGFKSPLMRESKFLGWIRSLAEQDRYTIFKLCVFLFGVHEGERLEACAGQCSHWWHMNLKDAKVVQELLRGKPAQLPPLTTKTWWKFW